MAVQLNYPHIETPPDDSPRLARLPRIRVAQIAMDYLAHGWSVDEMCRQHPGLTAAELHAAMAYYFDHQEQIDAEIKSEWEQVRRERVAQPETPFVARMRAKGVL